MALVVGSGALAGGRPTVAERAAALETQLRCPSCLDVSVADSSAATAAALRRQVVAWVRQGRSDQAIENALVARYGPGILLEPPTSGLGSLIVVLPAVAGGIAVLATVTLLWRRARSFGSLRAEAIGEPR